MEIINYPLLYFQINDSSVLGVLVGTGHQVIEKDVEAVKAVLGNYLHKQYKKHGDYPYIEIEKPKLKIINVSIRPSYQTEDSAYPTKKILKVPIPIIYGMTDTQQYQCYVPLLYRRFSYYEAAQLDTLAQHFTTHALNRMPPKKIYSMLQYPKPKLDAVSLKVNLDREVKWGDFDYKHQNEVLPKLAEQYPSPHATRKRKSPYPDAAWKRETEIEILAGELVTTRANVLLVGESGTGKSAIMRAAIRNIKNAGKKQEVNFTFWNMLPDRITSSSKYLGEWQETCEVLIEELAYENGVLWVEDIMQLLSTGGESPESSVAAFFLPFMQQGQVQLVGEVTPRELDKMRQLLPEFVQSFRLVQVKPMDETQVQSIFDLFATHCEQRLKVDIKRSALNLSFRLLNRYIPYEGFPGKGIKFLSKCVNEALFQKKESVEPADVIHNFIEQTGMPALFLDDNIRLDTKALEHYFSSRIIGQPDAVEKMSVLVKIFKARLNDPRKPIQTLLFAGPTGVGKTASAKVLADYFFGQGQKSRPLIRIDMSEFQYPSQFSRLVGNGNEVGQLVKEVREKPFSVILFDEIEKAHPAVFDALLSLLDEGLIVDAFGRTTNFRNTIIIMASNIGASEKAAMSFKDTTSEETRYLSAIGKFFKPEFVNRIDGVVLFNSLSAAAIHQITRKELEELKMRDGFKKFNLQLAFSEKLIHHLATVGFDKKFGARPLQRAIEEVLVSPLAKWLLQRPEVKDCMLQLDYDEQLLVKRRL